MNTTLILALLCVISPIVSVYAQQRRRGESFAQGTMIKQKYLLCSVRAKTHVDLGGIVEGDLRVGDRARRGRLRR